jgi:hypothetical protein
MPKGDKNQRLTDDQRLRELLFSPGDETEAARPTKASRHKAFSLQIAGGRTLTDAYRMTHDCKGLSASGIASRASKLAASETVQQTIRTAVGERVRASSAAAARGARDVMLALWQEAERSESPAAARISALGLIGKELGMFVNRSEVKVEDARNINEIAASVHQRLSQFIGQNTKLINASRQEEK